MMETLTCSMMASRMGKEQWSDTKEFRMQLGHEPGGAQLIHSVANYHYFPNLLHLAEA